MKVIQVSAYLSTKAKLRSKYIYCKFFSIEMYHHPMKFKLSRVQEVMQLYTFLCGT